MPPPNTNNPFAKNSTSPLPQPINQSIGSSTSVRSGQCGICINVSVIAAGNQLFRSFVRTAHILCGIGMSGSNMRTHRRLILTLDGRFLNRRGNFFSVAPSPMRSNRTTKTASTRMTGISAKIVIFATRVRTMRIADIVTAATASRICTGLCFHSTLRCART